MLKYDFYINKIDDDKVHHYYSDEFRNYTELLRSFMTMENNTGWFAKLAIIPHYLSSSNICFEFIKTYKIEITNNSFYRCYFIKTDARTVRKICKELYDKYNCRLGVFYTEEPDIIDE